MRYSKLLAGAVVTVMLMAAGTANAALTFKVTDTSGGGSVIKCSLGPVSNNTESCGFGDTSFTFTTTKAPNAFPNGLTISGEVADDFESMLIEAWETEFTNPTGGGLAGRVTSTVTGEEGAGTAQTSAGLTIGGSELGTLSALTEGETEALITAAPSLTSPYMLYLAVVVDRSALVEGGDLRHPVSFNSQVSIVPLPAAGLLLLGGLGGLGFVSRKRKAA